MGGTSLLGSPVGTRCDRSSVPDDRRVGPKFAEAGGLLVYATNFDDLFRQAADYIDKVLRGTVPGELPVQQAATFELVVNLKAARALGLTIPPSILARADEVIE